MKNLSELIKECKADLDLLGIKYSKRINWSVNTRAKKRWGICKKFSDGHYEISIAAALLEDAIDRQSAKNTIVHELLHTVWGCYGHKGKWKSLAQRVNCELNGYSIKRVTSLEEKGFITQSKPTEYRYLLRCKNCGAEIGRQRESKAVINYKNYRCSKCRGELERLR